MREERRTGGEPVLIRYREPEKSHARVILLTDISGPCRHASTLALYFMVLMDDAFPGGCTKYAFVYSLVDVDRLFQNCSQDEAVRKVQDTIPTRGACSDYGWTLHQFRHACAGQVRHDTTILILGDAGNNWKDSCAEDLTYLADRCRRIFWLNPADPELWGEGDSIISEYERAGARVFGVRTVADLLRFLENVAGQQMAEMNPDPHGTRTNLP